MAEIFVPPHLQIDPLRPVQFFLQGTSTGVGAAEARNRAQVAAMELAQRAAAQQAANERAALAAQSDAAQLAARVTLAREENEQKAALTARRYAASNAIREAIAGGMPAEQAFFQNPDFFLESPAALSGLARERQVTPTPLERNVAFLRQLNPSLTDAEAATMVRAQIEGGGGRFAPDAMARALEHARQADIAGDKKASDLWQERAATLARGGPLPAAEALRRFEEKRKQEEAAGGKKTSSGFTSWLKSLFGSTEKAEEKPAPEAGTNLAPVRKNVPLTPRASTSNPTGEVNRVRVIRPDGTRGWIIGSPADIDAALRSGTYVLDSPGASGSF